MVRSTLSHLLTPDLTAWQELVSAGPTGPEIDFFETNQTRLCQQRCEAFVTDPSPETFRKLWNAEALASYWAPSTAALLGADSALDSLQTVCSELLTAEEFDPTWVGRLAGSGSAWGVYELMRVFCDHNDPQQNVNTRIIPTAFDTMLHPRQNPILRRM